MALRRWPHEGHPCVGHAAAVRGRHARPGRLGRGAVRRRLAGGAGRRHPRLRVGVRVRPVAAAGRAGRGTRHVRGGQRHQGAQARPRGGGGAPRRPDPGARLGLDPRPDALCPAVGEHGPGRRPRAGLRPGRRAPRGPGRPAQPRGRHRGRGLAAVVPAGAAVSGRTERQRRRRRWTASSTMRRGAPAAIRVSGVRRYDLGTVAGVGLAITDAISLSGGLVLVSAAAEDSPSTYDDGPVVGSRPRPARRRPAGRPGRAPAAGRRGGQARGAGPASGTATTCSTWSRSSTPTTRRCRRCCWS